MVRSDFELGMDNAVPEPLVDVALLLTACSFTLLVGIIIGYYVETILRRQNIIGKQAIAPSPSLSSLEHNIESNNVDAGVAHPEPCLIGNSANAGISSSDTKYLRCKPSKVPKHIAVIMDGNRRFGRQRHGNSLQGHWAGGQTLVDFVQWCKEDGVQVATVYAFSTENWSRDPLEVQTLMGIFAKYAEKFRTEALAHNVRVNVFSTDRERLPEAVRAAVQALETATCQCTSFTLNICLSYGSRGDITSACRSVAGLVQAGKLDANDVSESHIAAALCTSQYADPDILVPPGSTGSPTFCSGRWRTRSCSSWTSCGRSSPSSTTAAFCTSTPASDSADSACRSAG